MSRIGLGRHGRIADNAGDPLDGLVNLFDVGIVLAVAFLIAGLSLTANSRTGEIERRPVGAGAGVRTGAEVGTGAKVRVLSPPAKAREAHGRGTPIGSAYRLADGRLVIVSPR